MLCICLPFAAGECFAQRYLPGQKGIQLMLGGVDDFGSNVKHLRGNFQLGVALSRYNRNHSRWLFGADYVKKHYFLQGHCDSQSAVYRRGRLFRAVLLGPWQERVLLCRSFRSGGL